MKERGWIEAIVERVAGQVLDSHAAQIRTEIVRRVMDEIAVAPGAATTSSGSALAPGSADLARAVAEIQLGTSQREILRALLDTGARYAARIALFVVKGSHATGWQARGFAKGDAVKDFALDQNAPAVVRTLVDQVAASAKVADLDARFLGEVGAPASGEAWILPLMLKDKVAALVYADGGPEDSGLLDSGSLELLVLSTSAWLEVNSLRKQAHKDSSAVQSEGQSDGHGDSHSESHGPTWPQTSPHEPAARSSSAPAAPAFNDPFAASAPVHAVGHAMAASASAGTPSECVANTPVDAPQVTAGTIAESTRAEAQSAVTEVQSALAASGGEAEAPSVGLPPIAPDSFPPTLATSDLPVATISPEEQDVHRKAQRFARLLVDEIKLYNQAKVVEGRKNKDLYDRLQEAIEKSRAMYQKRYGNTVAASGDYFQHEIIRSLAEDDLSIMGADFRQ